LLVLKVTWRTKYGELTTVYQAGMHSAEQATVRNSEIAGTD